MCYVLNLGHIFLKSSIVITYNINKFTYLFRLLLLLLISGLLLLSIANPGSQLLVGLSPFLYASMYVSLISLSTIRDLPPATRTNRPCMYAVKRR